MPHQYIHRPELGRKLTGSSAATQTHTRSFAALSAVSNFCHSFTSA